MRKKPPGCMVTRLVPRRSSEAKSKKKDNEEAFCKKELKRILPRKGFELLKGAIKNGEEGVDSYTKAYERMRMMLKEKDLI